MYGIYLLLPFLHNSYCCGLKEATLTWYPTLQVTEIAVKVSNYGIWLKMDYITAMEEGYYISF